MTERILLVHSETPIREIVCSMLVAANYQCQEADSGYKALALLGSGERFDLILTDLMMANLDGIGLLEKIRAQYPDMPVVFITAVHDVEVALMCLRGGAYDYLLSPFERKQLLATTRRALHNHRERMQKPARRTTLTTLITARTEQLRAKLSKLERSEEENPSSFYLDDDPEAYRHNKSVTTFTIAVARAMRLPSEQIDVIARGASLYDIGQVPALRNVLIESKILLPDELAILCQLLYDVHEMLKPISSLREASEIIYAHPELFDGTGYRRGLKGDEIPLGARIFSTAYAMLVLTSPTFSSPTPPTVASAHAEIQRRAGHQLDPEVVEAVLSLPEGIWADLRKEAQSQ